MELENTNTQIVEYLEMIEKLVKTVEMAIREGWDIPFSKSQELSRAKSYIGISGGY